MSLFQCVKQPQVISLVVTQVIFSTLLKSQQIQTKN